MVRIPKRLNLAALRIVILLLVVAIGAAVALFITHNNSKQFAGARPAADGFASAVASCNAAKAKQYYQGFSNAANLQYFTQHCLKGGEKLQFDHDLSTLKKTEKGVATRTAYFDYRLAERGKSTSHVVITAQWTSKTQRWYVISAQQQTAGTQTYPASK